MIYQVEKILQDVRVCLDRNKTDDALLTDGDEETLLLDDIIRSKIVEASELVLRRAPYYMLEQGHNFEDTDEVGIHWEKGKPCGWLLLPDDFMRLIVFEMSDWETAVYSMIMPGTLEYRLQRSRIGGVRGTPERPVCVYGVRPYGKVLEFYSCKNQTATVTQGVYLPYPRIEEINNIKSIDLSERCYKAVVYTMAGLTLSTIGESDRMELMMQRAEDNLNQP